MKYVGAAILLIGALIFAPMAASEGRSLASPAAGLPAASAQPSPDETARLLALLTRFRQKIFADGVGIDECSARETIGDSSAFAAVLSRADSSDKYFARRAGGCTGQRAAFTYARIVVVDSVHIDGDRAVVSLAVRQGEHSHRERYTLGRPNATLPWQGMAVEIDRLLRIQRR